MSVVGTQRRCQLLRRMSALRGRADVAGTCLQTVLVRFHSQWPLLNSGIGPLFGRFPCVQFRMTKPHPGVDAAKLRAGQRVVRKTTDELGTVIEANDEIKVKWDGGRTSY